MMSIHIEKLQEAVPDYTTMWWRVVKVKVHLNPKINLENDPITIAVDSTGIKVTNRGEWIREKWNNNNNNNNNNSNKRRGFIKIHIAVNVRTKKVLSMEVTKEDVYDGKMLKKLVNNVVSENNYVKKVLADDGAYDSKDNFSHMDKMKIEPIIRVRKNSSTKACVCIPRKMVVIEQLRDMKRWKKKHEYGMRWIAESAFSSIKRIFGEYVSSIKWNNIVNELLLKAYIYNMFVDKTAV